MLQRTITLAVALTVAACGPSVPPERCVTNPPAQTADGIAVTIGRADNTADRTITATRLECSNGSDGYAIDCDNTWDATATYQVRLAFTLNVGTESLADGQQATGASVLKLLSEVRTPNVQTFTNPEPPATLTFRAVGNAQAGMRREMVVSGSFCTRIAADLGSSGTTQMRELHLLLPAGR